MSEMAMLGSHRRWVALVLLCLSLIVVVMDNTIVNVALPRFSSELDASTQSLQWIVDAFALSLGSLLLVGGRLGDRWGRRRVWQVGLVLFAAASAWAAMAPSSGMLIAARASMGASAALIMPGSLALISDTFALQSERAKAISIWAACTGVGVILGPVIGGALLDRYWWGSVFLINIAPCCVLAFAGMFALSDRSESHPRSTDPVAVVLSSAGLGGLVWAVIEGPSNGWTSPVTMIAFGTALAALGGYVWRDTRAQHPLLDLRLLARADFGISSLVIAIAFFVLFGIVFGLTQYLQLVDGYSPLQAGIRIVPFAIGVGAGSGNAPRIARIVGARTTAGMGLIVLGAGVALLELSSVATPYWVMLPGLIAMGCGVGFAMAPSSERIMSSATADDYGVASSVNDISRELGGAFGVAILGTLSATSYHRQVRSLTLPHGKGRSNVSSLAQTLQYLSIHPRNPPNLDAVVKTMFVHSIHLPMIVAATLAAGSGIGLLWRFRSEWGPARTIAIDPASGSE